MNATHFLYICKCISKPPEYYKEFTTVSSALMTDFIVTATEVIIQIERKKETKKT